MILFSGYFLTLNLYNQNISNFTQLKKAKNTACRLVARRRIRIELSFELEQDYSKNYDRLEGLYAQPFYLEKETLNHEWF